MRLLKYAISDSFEGSETITRETIMYDFIKYQVVNFIRNFVLGTNINKTIAEPELKRFSLENIKVI